MSDTFDVFLCHSSSDKPAVRQLADELERRGLRVWLDERELLPGKAWRAEIEAAMENVSSIAVVLGPGGPKSWQNAELDVALQLGVDRGRTVIPVLLPGVADDPGLPLFLKSYTWLDLRNGFEPAALDRLAQGIRGTPADRPAPAAPPRELIGKLFHRGESGEQIAEAGIAVSLEPPGGSATTNSQGIFRLPLPPVIRADDKVTLGVEKAGWRIYHPLDGEVRVPAEPRRHLEHVELMKTDEVHPRKIFGILLGRWEIRVTALVVLFGFSTWILDLLPRMKSLMEMFPGQTQGPARKPASRDQVLRGRITDTDTGQPLAGVRLWLPVEGNMVVSDADGLFTFELAAKNGVSLVVLGRLEGYEDLTEKARVGDEELAWRMKRRP